MNHFRELRRITGWTQAELADRIGVQRSAIANYEAGYPPARVPALKFMALARDWGVDCTLEELYQDHESA